jgi:prevent-host-death family protein
MKTVTAVEAKLNFGAVLDAVEAGEEVLVTRDGRPIARIAPANDVAMSRQDALVRLAAFGDGRRLGGLSLLSLRDEGRR